MYNMKGFLTRPKEAQCGAFTEVLPLDFMSMYNRMLKGEELEIAPIEFQYAVNKDITHYRTSFFELDRITRDINVITRCLEGSSRIEAGNARLPHQNMAEYYTQFRVPKRSGGFRTIDAPSELLKDVQRNIVNTLQYAMHLHPHEIAHAYVSGRSPKTALEVHQANESKWFLKLDIKDFFPSCTSRFVLEMLEHLYPLNIYRHEGLWNLIWPAFLNDALPQGGVTSPLLSNLAMLPLDWRMRDIRDVLHQEVVVTRYADDILISSKYDFDFKLVEKFVSELFEPTTLRIKHEKTRYGSAAGQNWNLGLMLNKDNNITVGTQRKTAFKRSVFNLLMDFKKGVVWTPEDKLQLRGMYSYLHSIEPSYTAGVIRYYEQKTGASWEEAVKVS